MSEPLKLVPFDSWSTVPADTVLQSAMGQLKRVVVVGIDQDGATWVSSSDGDHEKATALCLRGLSYLAEMERP